METVAIGVIIFLSLFVLAVCVFYAYCMWKIYEKAGQPGWTAIVPIYNYYILTKIIGKPWWWTILLCLSFGFNLSYGMPSGGAAFSILACVGFVFAIWAINLLSKSFGKDIGFTLGLIFLGFIFLPIMAFDRTIQYRGPAGNPSAGSVNDQIQGIGADMK